MTIITINPERTDVLKELLLTVWKSSVRSTHRFLTEEDIFRLVPAVRNGIARIETLFVVRRNGGPAGFMGIEDGKIEMLFIGSEHLGKGLGKAMTELAIHYCNVRYVNVNEQNPAAAGFYLRMGFEVFGRTEHDEQGNPFPLLQMRLHAEPEIL